MKQEQPMTQFQFQDNFDFFTFVETGAAHETSHHLEQLALEHVTLLLQGLRPKLPFICAHFYFFLGKFVARF